MAHNDTVDDYQQEVEKHAGHLSGDDLTAVLCRAAEIAQAEADGAVALYRLARASGCPEDIPALPWLHERGLIERLDNGRYFLSNKPGPSPR